MESARQVTRRDWLFRGFLWVTAGAGLTAFGRILADMWAAGGHFSSAHWVEVASPDEVPPDAAVPFPDARVALVRRGNRIGAVSLECPHLGCLVNAMDQSFLCPCHGSEFGPLGEVYTGPATRSLPWHPLEVRGGRIWIHSGRKLPDPQWISTEEPARSAAKGV